MQAQITYDWDDIAVGDNSQNLESFFGKRHEKHEKHEKKPEKLLLLAENISISNTNKDIENPEQINQNKVLESIENIAQIIDKVESKLLLTPDKRILTGEVSESHKSSKKENISIPTAKNLKIQWSSKKTLTSEINTVAKNVPAPPQAYRYKDTYEKHKQELIRKNIEREKENRIFHSKPVPNFSLYHQQLERKKASHKVTPAVTPIVLKKSKEMAEKRRQKLTEWKSVQTSKFTSRLPTVLEKEPFKPKKHVTILKTKPFNLNSEKRLEERKHFDEKFKRMLEEKKKQGDEERKKREEKEAKELRKMASNFKATPNPFK